MSPTFPDFGSQFGPNIGSAQLDSQLDSFGSAPLDAALGENSLDQLVSPDARDVFVSPQYFSPQRLFPLNAIAENNSRRSSAGFLSPRAFVSPPEDTLRLPYSGSVNSPPQFNLPNTNNNTNNNSTQSSAPAEPTSSSVGANLTPEEKARRRREFHNAVERRRRDLIKEKIKELGVLVPPLLLTPQVCAVQAMQKRAVQSPDIQELLAAAKVKEAKPNKAAILQTSVDYIRHLKKVVERQQARRAELEQEVAAAERRAGQGPPAPAPEFNPDEFFADVLEPY